MPITFESRFLAHPANRAWLEYLSARAAATWNEHPVRRPEETKQPYLTLGAHPDVVERLWKQLSKDLPERCDWVVYATPVLVHPSSAVLFAIALGTVYAIRLPAETRKQAVDAGAKSVHRFSKNSLDLAPFGDGWMFGTWHKQEPDWCLSSYQDAGRVEGDQ